MLSKLVFADQQIDLPEITDQMVSDVLAGKCDAVTNSLTQGLDNTTLDRGEVNEALAENDLFESTLNLVESCNTGIISMPLWETDGHYSTVYLVALTLGLPEDLAKNLAIYSEQPDTYVHSEYDFELNQTWSYPKEQWNTHALTNGFHGIEEMASALKFLYTPESDIEELGRLLHRFGDSYAHAELSNTDDWSSVEDVDIYNHIEPWMRFINNGIKENTAGFLNSQDAQRQYLNGMTLEEYLGKVYLNHESDKFKMYGDKVSIFPITDEHFSTPEKSQPDYIWVRPRWYYLYVNNLAKILALKYNIKIPFDARKFETMIGFAKRNRCKLKGIIDFEIARKLNKNYFIVPVFYADNLLIANIDEMFFTDYMKEAKNAKDNALKYIAETYPNLKVKITEIKAGMNFNSQCFYNTVAYKLTYN